MSFVTAALLIIPAASGEELQASRCPAFLAGDWAGKRVVWGFGPPIRTDNTAHYRRDGTFETLNRYVGVDKRWHEQKVAGTWRAFAGRTRKACTIIMASSENGFHAESWTEVIMVDADTYRSLGFDMRRIRK